MINRGNWKHVQSYLKYRKEVDQLAYNSLRLEETWLRHLLEWLQEYGFDKAPKKRPTFPEYMLTARLDGTGEALSPAYVQKVIRASNNFFQWLKTHQWGFSSITPAWLDTLKPPRMTVEYEEHEAVTIDEIRAIAKAPVYSLRERRIRAAAVFWFLSGIRIGAFVTLPIKAVDLENLTVKQWPKFGVHTKFHKHATTYLLNIPELNDVVKNWDALVRDSLSENNYWFAPISTKTGELDNYYSNISETRDHGARKDLKEWLDRVKLDYHSPHKFRHGNAVYSLMLSNSIAELKAVSQNLMHSSIRTTDAIYGILSNEDARSQINAINERIKNPNISKDDNLIVLLKTILRKLET